MKMRIQTPRFLNWFVSLGCLVITLFVTCRSSELSAESNWLGFRGDGTGVAAAGPQRLELGDQGNRSWDVPMPGRSVAGPIVVGELVITTSSAGPNEENLFVTGVDIHSGATRWQQQFRATGRPFFHPTGAGAAPSPVSDGQRIVALYSSNDLVCLSSTGDLLWARGLGHDYNKAGNDVGMASSPVIAGDVVVVLVENQGDSFAAGIDLKTGVNRWRIKRPPLANWSSPAVINTPAGGHVVVFHSSNEVVAVDAATGETSWSLGEGRGTISSPTVFGNILLLPGEDLLAMETSAAGETPTELWREDRLSPKNASVVVDGKHVFVLKGSVLLKAELQTGDLVWQERLSGLGGTWATPVVAGSYIYVFDQSGVGLLIEDSGESVSVKSQIELEEGVLGTPALAGGKLIVRSKTRLHCFE
jgi:outer membrane protein assembly factor BamB